MEDINNNQNINNNENNENNENNKYNLSNMMSYFADIINPIRVELESNKIKNIYNIDETSPINDKTIKKIKELTNKDGFIKMNINTNNLLKIYNEILTHNKLLNDEYKININKIKLLSGTILLDFGSTLGLFLFTDDKSANIRTLITPRILFTNNYAEYINLIFNGIILSKILLISTDKNIQDKLVGKVNMFRDFLLKFFKQFNNSYNNETRFANLMNFIVNLLVLFFVIITLIKSDVPMNIVFQEAINMFTLLVIQFPSDVCYFDNNVLTFEPNICVNKNKSVNNRVQKCPRNYTFILTLCVYGTTLIIFILLIKINGNSIKRFLNIT